MMKLEGIKDPEQRGTVLQSFPQWNNERDEDLQSVWPFPHFTFEPLVNCWFYKTKR